MRDFNKIFCVGLPRCGGQSLQQALADLLHIETGKRSQVWHSVFGASWSKLKNPDYPAFVEVFLSCHWLERNFPGSLYIMNFRPFTEWLESCEKVYARAQAENWSHPIWKYPLEHFMDYYATHYDDFFGFAPEDRRLYYRFDSGWKDLCDFLDVYSIPTTPYPNNDKFGRLNYHSANPLRFVSSRNFLGGI